MMQPAIVVERLGKRFRRPGADRPTSLKEALLRGLRGLRDETFWGLRDISFSVARGRAVGVIGRNGAGKSTLLRLIGRVGRPDAGRVQARGRIGALLDLGAGLAHDLTGRENIFIAGVIAGMTRAEVQQRLDAIIAFAELDAFIDSP
ncbi:MAG: ATP-binding cassette domain-containing protein, partial [Anaerolineae bacterium]|nr:ATP-binding cassette domain-containing protein [Anaerolineae bacterium]